MTPDPEFKVTPLFEVECLRNGKRYRQNYNRVLIHTYTHALFKGVILNDLEWH